MLFFEIMNEIFIGIFVVLEILAALRPLLNYIKFYGH